MRRFVPVPLSIVLVTAFVTQSPAQQEQAVPETPVLTLKQSVAVFQFDNKTTVSNAVGQGMADLLVTALVNSDRFIVIERQELESVLQEQGLGLSGAVTTESAARVGSLLGVELAVFGSVTAFGDEKRSVGVRGLGVTRSRARVVADVRFVNTTTGEILYAAEVEGTESSLGLSVDTGDIDFSSVELWRDTRVGKAASDCVGKIVTYSSRDMADLPWHGTLITLAEDGPYCYIKPGATSGLQRGNVLYVYRKGQELIDPDLGISLGSEEILIGKIQIIDPNIGDGKASKCLILEGTGFARGDLIKIK